MRRRALAALTIVAAALAAPATVVAQSYPVKPIRWVVPFPAGGSSDLLARVLAQRVGDDLKQPVVVDNRPGASANIGHEIVARAPADGYTIVMGNSSTLTTNPFLFAKLPFDPIADFAPITMIGTAGQVLAVHPSVNAKSVNELIALLKAQPGRLNYGSGGIGIQSHISAEFFKQETGTQMTHIPYKGTGLAVADLVAGQVQIVFGEIPITIAHLKAGKIRPLAVTSRERVPLLPDVPTMAEAGMRAYVAEVWWSVMAPRGTPREIVNRLNGAFVNVIAQPEARERLLELGVTPGTSTPERVTEAIRADTEKWGRVVRAAGIRPE